MDTGSQLHAMTALPAAVYKFSTQNLKSIELLIQGW